MNSFSKEKKCQMQILAWVSESHPGHRSKMGIQGTHHPKFVTIKCHLRDTQKTINYMEMF